MSNGEFAYLILVIAGMVVFAATLAWVSRRPRDAARPEWSASRNSAPGSSLHSRLQASGTSVASSVR